MPLASASANRSTTVVGAVHRALASPATTWFFLAVWATQLLSSPWWLTPGTDDGFYLYQVFSFLKGQGIAVPFLDEWHGVYTNLPGYPFAQGSFFALWNAVGLPLNVYTHRAFQIACGLALVSGSVLLLRAAARGQADRLPSDLVGANTFLVLLGVTPLPVDTLFLRPEMFGLVLTVGGLLAFSQAIRTGSAAIAALSGLAIGGAMTAHPTFITAGGPMVIVLAAALAYRRAYRLLIASVLSGVVPIAFVTLYFSLGGELAWDEFFAHVSTREPRPGGAVMGFTAYVADWLVRPSMATVYLATPFVVLTGLLMSAAALLGVRFLRAIRARVWPFSAAQGAIHAFFAGSVVSVLLESHGPIQVFTVFGLATLLSFASSLAELWDERPVTG